MAKIGVAVIGSGSWGKNHARVYNQLTNASLEAVVDAREDIARNVAKQYGVKWYTDLEKAFTNTNIEAVSICTPTVTHYDLAKQAIELGKHVLVEKPMTNTVDEAKKLIRLSKLNGTKLTVGFVERFNSAIKEALKRTSDGEIGDVILAHTRRLSRRPIRIGDVGVIKDLAIHDIDIINQLFKDEATVVFASAGSIAHSFEDYANIQIGYHGNKSAFVETNWLTPRKIRTLTITGTEGIITVEYISQQIIIENNERLYQPYLTPEEPLYNELNSFINSILTDTEPEVTGEDGLKALKICEAAISSAKKREHISL